MAQTLDSEAVFKRKAGEAGLPQAALDHLLINGVNTYSKLAYAVTTPGTTPTEEGLRVLINRAHPDQVPVGTVSALRRLTFEGQTMVIAQIRKTVEGGEGAKPAELAPAERDHRIRAQRTRLVGLEVAGQLECSHQSYEYVHRMMVQDVITYLEPHRFTTRMSEVQRDKPSKEVVIDQQHLTIREADRKDKCLITDLFTLSQAFTRRALACDLMGLCTYKHMEAWHRFLLDQCQLPAPPHFETPSLQQVLRTDRAAWVRFAELLPSIKPNPDGSLPLDAALQDIRKDHAITFYLLPLPSGSTARPATPRDPPEPRTPSKRKRRQQSNTPPPSKGHGGKGGSKGKTPTRMPAEFQGKSLHHNAPDGGGRLCWNYNLKRGCTFAKPGERCARGLHKCLKCLGPHALHECPSSE